MLLLLLPLLLLLLLLLVLACGAHHGRPGTTLVCDKATPTTGDIALDACASTGRLQRPDCGWRARIDTGALLLIGGDCGLYWLVEHITDDQGQL